MALQVTLIKTPGGVQLPRSSYLFDQQGGTLGRADGNTWVLPDSNKFLSSCHCEIVYADNQFYLEDRSTNGTFLNGNFEPIGRGVRLPLHDGDFFDVGDYRFSVQMERQSRASSKSPFDNILSHPTDEVGGAIPFDELPVSNSSALFEQSQDPLAFLGSPFPKSGASQFDMHHGHVDAEKDAQVLLDNFVGVGGVASDFNASVDATPGIDQAISWPTIKQENQIPENWDDDYLGSRLSGAGSSQLAALGEDIGSPFADNDFASVPPDLPFSVPNPKHRVPLAERISTKAMRIEQPKPFSASVLSHPDLSSSVDPLLQVKPQKQMPASKEIERKDVSANHVLAEALGLDISRLSDSDIQDLSQITGQLMREVIAGMLGVLRSRASIKNEFRMNVTTIQPIENNPLKFSVNVDDALENLFIKKTTAYKKPLEAFREGFQEIAEHQLAMIAGIREGFDAMIDRFNPEQLEKGFNKQVKGSVIPGLQKAKYWNCYMDYYQGITDNMDSSFQHLFGSDFVSAYEDQLRRLAATRKRGEPNDNI